MNHRSPLSVTLLLVEVFLLGGWQIWQGQLYWQQTAILAQFDPTINLRYLSIGSFAWGAVWITAVFFHRKSKPSLRQLPHLVLLFFIYTGLIQLLFNKTPKSLSNWSVLFGVYGLIIGINYWLRSRASFQSYINREEETQV